MTKCQLNLQSFAWRTYKDFKFVSHADYQGTRWNFADSYTFTFRLDWLSLLLVLDFFCIHLDIINLNFSSLKAWGKRETFHLPLETLPIDNSIKCSGTRQRINLIPLAIQMSPNLYLVIHHRLSIIQLWSKFLLTNLMRVEKVSTCSHQLICCRVKMFNLHHTHSYFEYISMSNVN